MKNIALFNLDEEANPNYTYMSKQVCLGVFVKLNKQKMLIVPEMEAQRAKGIKKIIPKKGLLEELKNQLRSKRIKNLGIDYSSLTANQFKTIKKELKGIDIYDVSEDLSKLRVKKDKNEITNIRKACSITETILKKTIKNIKKFKTENEVKAELIKETIISGCSLSFDPIVASAENSSIPHSDGSGKIKKGFLVIDFGVKYKGYCADITRTLYLGKPSKKEIEDYELVKEAFRKSVENIKKGAKCKDPDSAARKLLGKKFNHALGHGIGLKEHESPSISPRSKDKFSEGMCFAIEPGIYLPGKYGIRIEANFVIEKGKLKNLSSMEHKLKIIKI